MTKCQALYDFEAEQDDDLGLKKGDIATIIEKVSLSSAFYDEFSP